MVSTETHNTGNAKTGTPNISFPGKPVESLKELFNEKV